MKKSKKSILISFVLGDGYIRVDKRYPKTSGALCMCHSIHQEEYLKYKRDLLHSLIGGSEIKIHKYTVKSFDKVFEQVRLERSHRYFRLLQKWMYPNKYDTRMLNFLDEKGLAIWYMDDGSIIANNRDKDGTCRTARTNIHVCTTKEIAESVCKYFLDKWNIRWTTFKENGGTFSIRCFHKEGKKFHNIIHPYIIPSMSYKQRFYYDTSAQPLENKVMI